MRETLSAKATEGQQIMYDFIDKVSNFEMPEKINVLSPDGQDQVVDNYRNYIQQVVDGQITAEEASRQDLRRCRGPVQQVSISQNKTM